MHAQTGALDPTFNIGTGITGSYVHALAVSSDGKILLGGNFTRVQGAARSYVAQLNRDGTVDAVFSPGPGANGEVLAVAFDVEGRALIGGVFSRVNNTNRNRIARLSTDGSIDWSFNPGSGADNEVRCIALQRDGKILIAGPFGHYNGYACNGLMRLNPDGSADTEFKTGIGVGGERFVDEIRELATGRILIAGDFPTYNGVKRASIARLNSDGALDTSFDPGTGAKPGDPILGMAIQPDGKILVAGSFTGFNGKPLNNIARLNADGSVDATFNPGSGTSGGPINGLLHSVALESDGKILIGGWFDRVDRIPRTYLARLLPDGKPDTNWNVRVDSQVRAIALQPDHKVLFAGDFMRVNLSSSPHLARLNESLPVPAVFRKCQSLSTGALQLELAGDSVRKYLLQVSDDAVIWRNWTNSACPNGLLQIIDPDAASHSCRFYRALLLD